MCDICYLLFFVSSCGTPICSIDPFWSLIGQFLSDNTAPMFCLGHPGILLGYLTHDERLDDRDYAAKPEALAATTSKHEHVMFTVAIIICLSVSVAIFMGNGIVLNPRLCPFPLINMKNSNTCLNSTFDAEYVALF